MKKLKRLKAAQKQELDKLRDQIAREAVADAWRRVIRAKIKMVELQLRYDYRTDIKNEIMLDKYLVTLRPWANRYKHKKNGGKGWKDDC